MVRVSGLLLLGRQYLGATVGMFLACSVADDFMSSLLRKKLVVCLLLWQLGFLFAKVIMVGDFYN